ncbi:hypothetical protein HanRHA438_Chr16g0782331 [Helianthus annuus]|nr:hypothetical protein HanRHA438_Chr16g0782331 [Helianthus annuus]
MVPIKCNQLLNQYPPLDLAEIKSQPVKLPKIIAVIAVQGAVPYGFPHLVVTSTFSRP